MSEEIHDEQKTEDQTETTEQAEKTEEQGFNTEDISVEDIVSIAQEVQGENETLKNKIKELEDQIQKKETEKQNKDQFLRDLILQRNKGASPEQKEKIKEAETTPVIELPEKYEFKGFTNKL